MRINKEKYLLMYNTHYICLIFPKGSHAQFGIVFYELLFTKAHNSDLSHNKKHKKLIQIVCRYVIVLAKKCIITQTG